MTTSTAVVLPRRDPGPVSVLNPLCSLPVLGGSAADGQSAAALFLWAHTRFSDDFDFGLHPPGASRPAPTTQPRCSPVIQSALRP
jgi:hypothetical protein